MSWIAATGQRWKLHVFFGLTFLTFACLSALFVSIGAGTALTPAFAIGALFFAAASYLWVASSIQCPSCHRRIGWLVLSAMGSSQWLLQLWRGEVCPSCGAHGP
jgi:hypothetical protein